VRAPSINYSKHTASIDAKVASLVLDSKHPDTICGIVTVIISVRRAREYSYAKSA